MRSIKLQDFIHAMLLLFTLCCFTPTYAHEQRPAVADLSSTSDRIYVEIQLDLEAILTITTDGHDRSAIASDTRYKQLRALSSGELEAVLDKNKNGLLAQLYLIDQHKQRLVPEIESVLIPIVGNEKISRDTVLMLSARRPMSTDGVIWRWDERYGPLIIRSGESESAFSQFLAAGAESDQIPIMALKTQSLQNSKWRVVGDYIFIGFIHIIPKGIDHILFVVGLFLYAARWRPLLWQITGFSIAHTVALVLGMLNIISVPSHIVEPLIAISICIVCIENIFISRIRPRRIFIVFIFGLLHGLGFASVLSEMELAPQDFVTALVAFNIGVELGQLCIVFICFALIGWWFRNKGWYRTMISLPASGIVASLGFYWFAQRLI